MALADALGLGDQALVSFVGAGGKKTAARRLVDAGAARGRRVGYTTTTHTPPLDGLPVVLADPGRLPWRAAPSSTAGASPALSFARGRVPDPDRAARKLRGYDPATVDDCFAAGQFDWLLVKADGARRREFKAPGPDEPVVPSRSTDVVVVVSVRAVGRRLDAPTVHRPERVAALSGRSVGDSLTTADLAAVLAAEGGGLRGVPAGARVHLVVNKADTPALTTRGRAVVDAVRERTDRYATTLVTALDPDGDTDDERAANPDDEREKSV